MLSVEIYCPEIRPGIISATHHGAGVLIHSGEVSYTGEIALATVAFHHLVAPSGILRTAADTIATVRVIPHCVYGLARESIEHSQQFFAALYASPLVAVVGMVVYLSDSLIVGYLAHVST